MVETTAGVEQRKITDPVALVLIESLEATGDCEALERYWRLRSQLSERGFTLTHTPSPTEVEFCNKCGFHGQSDERGNHKRPATGETCPYSASQPRPTEIRDPILRLFIEEILRQTPNGEAIRVTYHPNGEWSVLPEATGKADAGLAKGNVWDRIADHPYVRGFNAGIKHGRAQAAALATGADGVAAEREACAALAEDYPSSEYADIPIIKGIAHAIRARMGEG